MRFRLTTDWRWLQILLFTAGFAGWAAVWGIVSTRNRRYRISILTSALGECPPTELKLCWGLMFLGGCAALTIPISLLFLWGPFLFPTMYFALLVGVMAVARGAARDTQGLGHVATLQSICFVACDPINLILGAMELNLLRRPSVQEFLRHANGGQADEQRKRWLFFL
ncbi:MAG TPA: hypothetical protein VFV87_09900 [Pirellulaceae bacterium]|nr:hypothetical protein [Pirellulaceae bacterium]